MSFREIVWPSRWKVTLAFLIAAVSVLLIYAFTPYYRDALFGLDYGLRVVSVFLSFGILTLIYYPLSCGVVFLYKSFLGKHKKKAKRKEVAVAAALILIFNPLTFSLLYAASFYVMYYPCGVQVMGFTSSSPAELAGIHAGEIISQVGGQAIGGTDSLTRVLAGKSPGESVRVKTNLNEYDVQLGQNPETNRTIMGVITQTAYCRRW